MGKQIYEISVWEDQVNQAENLVNKNTVTTGIALYADGTTGEFSSWVVTDYISVTPNTAYIGSNLVDGGTGNSALCFYDINQNYISGIKIPINQQLNFLTPEKCYYIRTSIRNTNDLLDIASVEIRKNQENKIAIIGSNDMTATCRAVEPQMVSNVNGTNTFTFKMYYKYVDDKTGEVFDNPFLNLLVNERKIKVYWPQRDSQQDWYDLIIKKCEKDSSGKSITYTCTDLFINELSKTGFDLEFDNELENNQGTIIELGTRVVDGTDWQVIGKDGCVQVVNDDGTISSSGNPVLDINSSELIKQKNEESVYEITLSNSVTAQKDTTDLTETIASGSSILVFYSCVPSVDELNSETFLSKKLQFLYNSEGYVTDTNSLLVNNADCYSVDVDWRIELVENIVVRRCYINNVLIFGIEQGRPVSNNYRGLRLVDGQKTVFDPLTEKYCEVFTDENDNEIYKFTETDYSDVTTVVNLVINSNNFVDTTGWSTNHATAKLYPNVRDVQSLDNYDAKGYLFFDSESDKVIYNSALQGSSSFLPDGLQIGETFRVRVRAYDDDNGAVGDLLDSGLLSAQICTYTVSGQRITPAITSSDFVSYTDTVVLQQNGDWLEADLPIRVSASRADLIDKNIGLFLFPTNSFLADTWYKSSTSVYSKSFTPLFDKSIDDGAITFYNINSTYNYIIYAYDANGATVGRTTGVHGTYHTVKKNSFTTDSTGQYDSIRFLRFRYYKNSSIGIEPTVEAVVANDQLVIRKGNYDSSYQGQYISPIAKMWVEDVQFFKKVTDANGNVLNPNSVLTTDIASTYYCYYNKTAATAQGIIDSNDIKYIYKGKEDLIHSYQPIMNNFEKIRSIQAKQSNRFNILQTLAETFECWAKFTILHESNGAIPYGENGLPKKYITFVENVGIDNGITFHYGIDLNTIKRTLDSEQFVTKTIVTPNSNEFADNGFCSIARSIENPIRENFIFNFDYYILTGLIDPAELNRDLYTASVGYNLDEWTVGDDIPITPQRYNESSGMYVKTTDTTYQSNKNYYVQKEYSSDDTYIGYYYWLYKYNTEYDKLTDSIDSIDTILLNQESTLKLDNDYLTAITERCTNIESEIRARASALNLGDATDYFKNTDDDTINGLLASWRQQQNLSEEYEQAISVLEDNIESLKDRKQIFLNRQANIITIKKQLHFDFFKKYNRFIQEGSWTSEDYIDDNLYYFDALNVAITSSIPQISYDINVLRLSALEEFKNKTFNVGDICYIQDNEFFNGIKQVVIISEITSNFDEPSKDKIVIQNYKSQFEDLFQRITATTQSLQYASGSYNRAANAITTENVIEGDVLQDSFARNEELVISARNESVYWDETGLVVMDLTDASKRTRITSGGLFITTDGGATWKNAVRGEGIATSYLTSGSINVNQINLFDGKHQTFRWDATGINAYQQQEVEGTDRYNINLSTFVRFDQYGIYGIANYENIPFTPDSEQDIKNNALFGLTWSGLFVKHKDGNYYTEVSNENDIRVVKTGDSNIELIKIGRLGENNFGLRINNINGEPILQTYNNGTLWLEKELNISSTSNNYNIKIGYLTATKPDTTIHQVINANNKFIVYEDGSVVATDGYFEGTIEATSGRIGSMDVDEDSLTVQNGSFYINDGSNNVLSFEENQETHQYELVITGTINATAGRIGSMDIGQNSVTINDGDFYIKTFQVVEDMSGFEPNTTYYILVGNEYQEVSSSAVYDPEQTYYVQLDALSFERNDEEQYELVITGNITATSGRIGGFNITETELSSTNTNNLRLNGSTGKITGGEIEGSTIHLTTSAIIDNYIELGNAKIYNPLVNNNNFITVSQQSGGLTTEVITIKDTGEMQIGQLNFSGRNSTISGNNFSIAPDLSVFSNINVSGKIVTSVFETNKVQSVGGIMLFKPSYKVESTNSTNNSITVDSEEEIVAEIGDKIVLVGQDGNYISGLYMVNDFTDDKKTIILSSSLPEDKTIKSIIIFGKTMNNNLFDPKNAIGTNNYYLNTDGTRGSNSGWFITNYIPVESNTEYIGENWVNGGSGTPALCFYDSDKGLVGTGISIPVNSNITFTTPNNCKFIRFSVRKTGRSEGYLNTIKVYTIGRGDLLIGVNSTSNSALGFLYPQGFSFAEFNDFSQGETITPKLFLGNLETLNWSGAPQLSGFGLYGENVYLTGSLVTHPTERGYAGVNTYNGVAATIFDNDSSDESYTPDNSNIVFWAGADSTEEQDIQNAKFQVTENGSIYASQGKFTGSVISDTVITRSTLYAADIYGASIHGWNQDSQVEAALQIWDTDKGIQFNTSEEEIVDGETIITTITDLQIDRSGILAANLNQRPLTINNENRKIYFQGDSFKTDNLEIVQDTIQYIGDNNYSIKFDQSNSAINIKTGNNIEAIFSNTLVYIPQETFQCNENVSFGGTMVYKKVINNNTVIGYNLFVG